MLRFLRRGPLVVVLMVVAACTGIYFDKGNAYPCDFAEGPGTRDLACVEGDACGTDNLCHPYLYEGPRFEGPPTIPDFAASGFERVHPRTLDRSITFLASSPAGDTAALLAGMSGELVRVNSRSQLERPFAIPASIQPERIEDAIVVDVPTRMGSLTALMGLLDGKLAVVADLPPSMSTFTPVVDTVPMRALRATSAFDADGGDRVLELQAIDAQGRPGSVDVVIDLVRREYSLAFTPFAIAPSDVVDIGLLTRSPGRTVTTPVVATRRPLRAGGTLELKNSVGFRQVGELASVPVALRFNAANTLMSVEGQPVLRDGGTPGTTVLSTWQVSFNATNGHDLVQAWPDCTPCPRGTLVRSTPYPPEQGLAVDVLCTTPDRTLSVRRVTGSNAVVDTDLCTSEELDLPFDETRISTNQAQEPVVASRQVGMAVGGVDGEIWFGETLSGLKPFALERVPHDVFPIINSGNRSLGALTDSYLSGLQVNATVPIGFRRIDERLEFDAPEDLHIMSSVHGIAGWGIVDDGQLVNFEVEEGPGSSLTAGASLVTAAGDPIRGSAGGEAFVVDGGLVAFFVAGDDGLYFVNEPEDDSLEYEPVLQPEPSVPIRSLALERTPLGTDGVHSARGYLVTSRNVYAWGFGGSPARWRASELPIASGEPVEVWFDTQRSALGRVGFSDGRIFTLPGGFQLANALPGSDDESVQLLDYENFGGWPIALASNGLFIARWDVADNGKLDNKFRDGTAKPMDWKKLMLPDGGTPWLGRDGKLFVDTRELSVANPDGGAPGRVFHFDLFVFLSNEVIKLGSFERK